MQALNNVLNIRDAEIIKGMILDSIPFIPKDFGYFRDDTDLKTLSDSVGMIILQKKLLPANVSDVITRKQNSSTVISDLNDFLKKVKESLDDLLKEGMVIKQPNDNNHFRLAVV